MVQLERTAGRGIRVASAGMALIAVCYGLARFAYGLFVPAFRAEFGLDAATAGAIASGSYLAYCVAVVAASATTSRWGARRVAAAAGLCAAAGTALIAAAPGVGVLAAGVVLAGASTGLASPPLAEAVAASVAPDAGPRVQSVVNAGTGLGVLVSGPVALLAGAHWRWAWVAFALVALVVAARVWWVIPDRDAGAPGPAPSRPSLRTVGPGTGRLVTGAALLGFGSAAVWTFGRDLIGVSGGGELTGTVAWIALGAAGLLGAFAGDVVSRVGLVRAWTVGLAALAASTVVVAVGASVPLVAVVAAGVFGAVYIALSGLLLLWGTRVRPAQPAVGVGAAFLFIALGQAAGAPLLGLVADSLSPVAAFVLAALVVVAGALARPAPEHR